MTNNSTPSRKSTAKRTAAEGSHPCPPQLYNDTIEQELLAAMINGNKGSVIELIEENAIGEQLFTSPTNLKIYRAIIALYNQGAQINLAMVTCELTRHEADVTAILPMLEVLKADGGARGAKEAAFYLTELTELAKRRKGYEAAHELAAKWADRTEPVERTQDYNVNQAMAIDEIDTRAELVSLHTEAMGEAINGIVEAYENGGIRPGTIPTGFAELDERLNGGLFPSELTIIAARPSVGKTALGLSLAQRMVAQGNLLFVSVEMSCGQLAERILSNLSGVKMELLRRPAPGKITDDDIERIHQAKQQAREMEHVIYATDCPEVTIPRLRSIVRRARLKHGVKAIIVDYLQLIDPVLGRTELRESGVRRVAEGLKSIAKQNDIPVIALAQLNRDVEKRGSRPRLSDLRESGAIEQVGEIVLLIHRPDEHDDKIPSGCDPSTATELIIAKHRQGTAGTSTWLTFDRQHATFTDLERRSIDPFEGIVPTGGDR